MTVFFLLIAAQLGMPGPGEDRLVWSYELMKLTTPNEYEVFRKIDFFTKDSCEEINEFNNAYADFKGENIEFSINILFHIYDYYLKKADNCLSGYGAPEVDNAKIILNNLINFSPNRKEGYLILSKVYDDENEIDKVIDILTKGVDYQKHPDFYDDTDQKLYLFRAWLYEKKYQIVETMKDYEIILSNNLDSVEIQDRIYKLKTSSFITPQFPEWKI